VRLAQSQIAPNREQSGFDVFDGSGIHSAIISVIFCLKTAATFSVLGMRLSIENCQCCDKSLKKIDQGGDHRKKIITLDPGANPTIVSYNASVVKSYCAKK
jgi:hypothetical protein